MIPSPLLHLLFPGRYAAALPLSSSWTPANIGGVNWDGDYPMWNDDYFVWGV
jgi:hypothetical protein